jgi:hypothetical protein
MGQFEYESVYLNLIHLNLILDQKNFAQKCLILFLNSKSNIEPSPVNPKFEKAKLFKESADIHFKSSLLLQILPKELL